MKAPIQITLLFLLSLTCTLKISAQPGLLISEILANPSGSDSPFEFVELIATRNIDFTSNPFTVIVCNNGTANTNGWIAGAGLTYAFQIDTGSVSRGDVLYVGGSSMSILGAKFKTKNTSTSGGDGGIGNFSSGGIIGNGGGNADGVAVFSLGVSSITSSSVPDDAVFFGTGLGTSIVSGGSAGYQLPVNDWYSGGKLQSTSTLAPDATSGQSFIATGAYDTGSNTFSSNRTFRNGPISDGTSEITLTNSNAAEILISLNSMNFTSITNEYSVIQSYVLGATMLSADVSLTVAAPFEISDDSLGPYALSLSIPAASAMLGDTVYVRYAPTSAGTNNAVILHTSSSLTKELALTGEAVSLSRIFDIQGSGKSSPVVNQVVITEGVIYAAYKIHASRHGFFMQDAQGDGNPLTSDGILVYADMADVSHMIGHSARISATVVEYFGRTQLENVTILELSKEVVPDLVPAVLPIPAIDKEPYEGMLVRTNRPLFVAENYNLARYGEVLLSVDSIRMNPTNYLDPNDNPAGGNSYSGNSNVVEISQRFSFDSTRSILLDDFSMIQNPVVIPFVDPVTYSLRIGSQFDSLKGAFDFAFGVFRIQALDFDLQYALRPEVPVFQGANITAAGFNVLNFFNGNGNGGGFPTSRGASSQVEFQRQSEKLYAALYQINADVVGLMEMENDGFDANSALFQFVSGLNQYFFTQSGTLGNYVFINDPTFIGSDEIKCAILYKSDKLQPIGNSLSSSNTEFSRPPVGQKFFVKASGIEFLFVVNHFKSKGCTDASGKDLDQLDGQGCYNEKRLLQAQALTGFINQSLTDTETQLVLAVGDYNAYEQEDPMDYFRSQGFISLVENSYSFVFNGNAGSLDHALINGTMEEYVVDAQKWHINAAEPRLLDYNTEFNPSAAFSPHPFRCSDHDPVIVGFNFPDLISFFKSEISKPGFAVHPNPVSEYVQIEGLQPGVALTILNAQGIEVYRSVTHESEILIDLAYLAPGIYSIHAANVSQKIVVR